MIDNLSAELSLKEIGNFLEKFAEKSENVYWLSTPDMKKLIYVSPAFEKIWGRAAQELYDSPEKWITYLHPDDIKENHPIHTFAENIALFGAKARYEENYRVIRPDGSICWIIHRGFPIYNYNNQCCGITGVAIDITKEKKAEEDLRRAKQEAEIAKSTEEDLRRSITAFAASIAHDLRTPICRQSLLFKHLLDKIEQLNVHVKQQNVVSSNLVKDLKSIHNDLSASAVDMNNLISESLKAIQSTITGIKTDEDLVVCSLWRCMHQIISNFPCTEAQKQLIHLDKSVDFDFKGNPVAFHRIISNLLKNSFEQIAEHRQGEIYIYAIKTKQVNQLVIKDTAGGVTEQIIGNMFKEFHTSKDRGTGIGLAFCKNSIKSFGGDITCHRVDNDRIEFRLILPKST